MRRKVVKWPRTLESVQGKEYLDAEEVAVLLNKTAGAIRNLVLRKSIPYRKPAGRLIFLRSEIAQWIEDAPGLRIAEIKNSEAKKEE